MRLAGTTLERNAPIPQFRLTQAASDREVTPWDLKGRRALVLAFLHDGCPECAGFAEDLAARGDQFQVADATVYAIASAAVPPLPTLLDPSGDVTRAYLGPDGEVPTVVLADRYGAAWAAYGGLAHDLPSVGELAATAWHMALSCADCAVPVWPEA
jgi:AhpC/TSA family protein